MRTTLLALASFASATVSAQTVTSVYNRDTHEPFHLKRVQVDSTVIGPIVRTSAWLTYDNPYKKLTEATLNFQLPDAAALSGFAYRYGDEYVPGQLMDKAKAWFIYTAITSRNRDPGIMEQWSPTEYHCQIFPLKQGQELRVRLWTVGMIGADGALPKPQVPNAVSYYETKDDTLAVPKWNVRSIGSGTIAQRGEDYVVDTTSPVIAVAQKFKDGRTYVAGTLRMQPEKPKIEILEASYQDQAGQRGTDVKAEVQQLLRYGATNLNVSNALFGDPLPDVPKQLRVKYRIAGEERDETTAEGNQLDFTANAPEPKPVLKGLRQPKTVSLDGNTFAFSGWIPKNRSLTTTVGGKPMTFKPKPIAAGADAARLWAQQMLATGNWKNSRQVLAFSMKYGVPSNATALLAVPKAEMARYKAKEKDYIKAQAEARRKEAEAARKQRAWEKAHPQNWVNSGGGDPEIRITIPDAFRVEAILPDRRVIALKADGDVWGGNFEIPASAPEGTYGVRIVAHLRNGKTIEKSWTYQVDRTAPAGKVTEDNGTVTVVSEPGLFEVAAYGQNGVRWPLHEVKPGVYVGKAPLGATVMLKDKAGNKGIAARR